MRGKRTLPFVQGRKPRGIGTPALTTRGMREPEMRQIAAWIGEVLASPDDVAVQTRVRGQVQEMCQQFPAPANAV